MSARSELTAEYVRQILDYDPSTGALTWRERADMRPQWNARYAGKAAGWRDSHGYWQIHINGRIHKVHRVAWLYMTGEWPKNEIDHRDTDRSNNRFVNLREATSAENKRNVGAQSNNTSGHKGVSWHKSSGKWSANIKVDNKQHHLGLFDADKKHEAVSAYERAAKKHHGEFARVA